MITPLLLVTHLFLGATSTYTPSDNPVAKLKTEPTNLDLVSKKSSISNNNSDIVSNQNKNSLQSFHPKLLSTTKSTVEVPSMSSSVAISIPTTSDDNFDSKQTVNSLQDLLKENTQSVSNVAPVTSTVNIQSISNVTPIPLHKQEGEYTGDLTVKGIRHGRGNMKYTVEPYLDDLYEGTWKFDKFYGNGKYTFSNGSIIKRKWINGSMHGQGTYTSYNGSVYSGEFRNDVFNGIGILTITNGPVYSGGFKDGLYHGRGTLIQKDGSVIDGIFESDKFLRTV